MACPTSGKSGWNALAGAGASEDFAGSETTGEAFACAGLRFGLACNTFGVVGGILVSMGNLSKAAGSMKIRWRRTNSAAASSALL